MMRTHTKSHPGNPIHSRRVRWHRGPARVVLAAALSLAAVVAADAQSTGGSGGGTSTPAPASGPASGEHHGSGGGGVGVGISVDVTGLFAGSHETRPANEWNTLATKPDAGKGSEIVVFRPDVPDGMVKGARIEINNSGHVEGGEWVVNWKPDAGKTAVQPLTPAGEGKPCPPKEQMDRLKARNEALQKQIDALKAENAALRTAAGEREVCKKTTQICEAKLTAAETEIARLKDARDEAQAAARKPGDGAKAIFVPFTVTYDGGREVDHAGWDVIRAVFDGNSIRVENHTKQWLAAHPGGPKDQDDWLRSNYGTIPTGHIDFGSASFGGQSLRERIEHLCEPPPSLDDVRRNKSVAHEFAVHYDAQSQRLTASSNGRSVTVSNPKIVERQFDLDLSAECLWTYDPQTGELKKQTMIQLSVLYQDENGRTHEVKYVADDPQLGWIMKS